MPDSLLVRTWALTLGVVSLAPLSVAAVVPTGGSALAAAVAAGENDEDVAGPVPWTDDRSLRFALFATHPSVEDRVARLGCDPPTRVRPSGPHRPGVG